MVYVWLCVCVSETRNICRCIHLRVCMCRDVFITPKIIGCLKACFSLCASESESFRAVSTSSPVDHDDDDCETSSTMCGLFSFPAWMIVVIR